MRLKPGSGLRVFHNSIADPRYENAIISDESPLEDSLHGGTLDLDTILSWEAICEPYKVLLDIFEKMKGRDLAPLKAPDLLLINRYSTVESLEVMESFGRHHDLLKGLDYAAQTPELLDKACALFREKWFSDLMEGLFRDYGVRTSPESIFSGFNRTISAQKNLCSCDLLSKPANERGCDLCDPVQAMYSSETIRINRNGAKHGGDIWNSNEESNLKARKKIWDSFQRRRETMNALHTTQHLKIVATMFHLLGFNSHLWETEPKSIEEIWENYPTEDPVDLMKRTIRSLLDNNEGWGRNNYVDDQNRVVDLKTELKGTKIVTIYGEGGLGKTELVYQTLYQCINDDNQSLRYDLLLPFTFKGDEQGEYSITSQGYRTTANQKGWQPIPSMETMVNQISLHLDEERGWGDDTEKETWYDKAVEVLVQRNVWLIIDNHEIDKGEAELDTLLNKFLNHTDVMQSNSRIIITTRVTPPEERRGRKIAMKSLNFGEMETLAKAKANWYYRFNREEDTQFPQNYYNTPSVWLEASNFIQGKLRTKRHERVAGHPYVVFIAVYVHMFENPEKKRFGEILGDLIEQFVQGDQRQGDGRLSSLMSYIIGHSFNYMTTCQSVEDAEMHLQLTHLQRMDRDDLEEIYGSGYRRYLAELVNLEILIESDDIDGEYVFRTEHHRYQLQEFVTDKFDISHPEKKWTWWKQTIENLKMDKRLSIASLRRIGVADQVSEQQANEVQDQFDLLDDYSSWDVHDVQACLNIVKHFGIVLSEIGEENQFLLAQANNRPDYQFKLVKFVYDVVATGLHNLAEYLAKHDNDNREPNLAMFRGILHFVHRVYNEEGRRFFVGDKESFPALKSFDEAKISEIGLGAIKNNLEHVLLQLLRNIPSPAKESLDAIRALWTLGRSKVADMSISASELMKVGLAQVQLSGFDESLKILHFLGSHAGYNQAKGRPIAADELELVYTGNFIREHKHLIEEDPLILECINKIRSHVYVKTENESIPGQLPKFPLFHAGDVTCIVELHNNRLLVGKDIEFQTNEITHHITTKADINLRTGMKHRVTARVTRYSVDGDVHYSILEEIITQEAVHNYPWEQTQQISSLRPIEDVSHEEMRMLLSRIHFDVSINGSTLFGALLKEVLAEDGIEHKGKIWRRWKAVHFPPEEDGPRTSQYIEDIIASLMEGAWIVERGEGLEIRIRKIPSLDSENEVIDFVDEIEDDEIEEEHEIYSKVEERVRPSIDWNEIYPPGPSHATSGHEGRRDLKRTGKRKARSRSRPACMKCRSRIHLSGISAGELYCGQCDHVIDASNGRCIDAFCTMC